MNVKKLYEQAKQEYEAENFDKAMKLVEKLKKADPKYRNAYLVEGAIWEKRHNYVKTYNALLKILPYLDTVSPEGKELSANVFFHFAGALLNLGFVERACKFYYLATDLTIDEKTFCSAMDSGLLAANCSEMFTAADFNALYGEYKKIFKNITPYPKKFYEHEKIRVGFLSSDFRKHAVMSWAWTLVTGLNKNVFEVYYYSNTKKSDKITDMLRKGSVIWRDITKLADDEAAKLIRDDEIDILFDLNGHTGGARFRVAAHRPAPVQISGIGSLNSTGFDFFDFFLSDVHCTEDAAATSEYFTEKVLRLPHCHIRYHPLIKVEHASEPPCIKNGYVTFGTFNNYRKISDSMLRVWKTILDAVPDSRLLLKSKIFYYDDGKKFVSERLKNFDIDPKRVEMRGWTKTHPLDYNDMDIALDTYPYTGCVTTCEALYMGVPVVSLYGNSHGTRMSYSTLKNIGLEELAVDNFDDYVKRAVALANDWDLIAMLRRNLRKMMEQSPLMDTVDYILSVQRAFVTILDYERKQHESEQNQ